MRGRTRNIGGRIGRMSALWNPLKLSGLLGFWRPASDRNYQDSAKTIACGDGDSVYTWATANSAVGVDLSQSTAANRPTFHTLPNRVTFDGSNDWLGPWSTGSPTGLFSFHKFKTSQVGYHNIYDCIIGAPAETQYVMLWIDDAGRLEPDATPGTWTLGPVVTDGAWHTCFVFRSDTVQTRLWVDGTEIVPTGGTGIFTRTIPTSIDLFGRSGSSTFNGSVGPFGFASALPSAADLARLQTYLAG